MRKSFLTGSVASILFLGAACSSDPTAADRPVGGGSGGSGTGTGSGGSGTGTGGTGTGTGTGGSSGTGTGSGGSNTGTGTGGTGGGSNGTGTGGTSNTGGAGNTGGTGGAGTGGGAGTTMTGDAAVCVSPPNLVQTPGCFVGCNAALTTDNPGGLQGSFYVYGDQTSCTPAPPYCTAAGVCMKGATVVDPTFTKFGCGIGFELNATGGVPAVKSAYAGPTKCFTYTLTGNTGGNEVRVGFTQSATPVGVAPHQLIPAFNGTHTGTVCFADVSCQGQTPCMLGTTPYDLQIGIAGGKRAAPFDLCLTDLRPDAAGASTFPKICGAPGAADGAADVGKYFAQPNVNNSPGGSICVTPGLTGAAASLSIDSSNISDPGNSPAAYPSLVDGWHFGRNSMDPALPKQISALTSVQTSVSYTGSNGKYNAAYDVWVLPSNNKAATTPAGGLEVMVWLNSAGVQPIGSMAGTYTGGWEVWQGSIMTWTVVTYRKTGPTNFTGDLAPIIKDAVARAGKPPATSYLAGIEFGFELWQNASTGFKVTSFTADAQ